MVSRSGCPGKGVDSMVSAPAAGMLAVAWYCPVAPLPYQAARVRKYVPV